VSEHNPWEWGEGKMLGWRPIGSGPIASGPLDTFPSPTAAALSISSIIIPEQGLLIPDRAVAEGILIKSTSLLWLEIAQRLGEDWSIASQFTWRQWEEIIAGAFDKAGYDEVVLTPASGDRGRDVIATKRGVGCVKIIDSVKAYRPGNLVTHDDVRALIGTMALEPDVSKGMLTTTSDFAPGITKDVDFARLMPTRLELMNGPTLQKWLRECAS
jgi:restriction system protein